LGLQARLRGLFQSAICDVLLLHHGGYVTRTIVRRIDIGQLRSLPVPVLPGTGEASRVAPWRSMSLGYAMRQTPSRAAFRRSRQHGLRPKPH